MYDHVVYLHIVCTVPEVPIMQVQALNASALVVMWERPEVLGAELLGYKLLFHEVEATPKTIILTGERTRHILLRLGELKHL